MIIDIHSHIFPDDVALKVADIVEQVMGIKSLYPGTVSAMRDQMNESGVDRSIVAGVASEPRNIAGINKWLTELPDSRFIPFATVHPGGNLPDQLNQIKQNHFMGIKMHPLFQQFIPDDPQMFPLYEEMGEKLVFLIHMGGGSEDNNTRMTPRRLSKLMDKFPEMRVIAAHFGGVAYDGIGFLSEVVEYLAPQKNIFFDTVWPPIDQVPQELVLKLVSQLGAERILFGTDCPHTHQSSEVAFWRNLPLVASDIDRILGDNAVRLLGL